MLEGGSSKTFSKIKKIMYSEPEVIHILLDKLAQSVILYLNAQIAAGAQAVMIFDTWGGVLTPNSYREYSLSYMQQIVDGLTRQVDGTPVPVTLFTKNGGLWLEEIVATGCDAVGLDWTIDIRNARQRVGDKVALQGNMDPAFLLGTPERMRLEVQAILDGYGQGSGHVFNLGHGITPDVDPEKVKFFIDAVHSFSRTYHIDNNI
jgi:uroporphyrinogen decarboxylase